MHEWIQAGGRLAGWLGAAFRARWHDHEGRDRPRDPPGVRLRTLDLADPGPGEILIEVAGVGVCHTDLAVQHGHLPFPLPAVLGHEGSGVVRSVGAGVTKVVPGDRVGATFNSVHGALARRVFR